MLCHDCSPFIHCFQFWLARYHHGWYRGTGEIINQIVFSSFTGPCILSQLIWLSPFFPAHRCNLSTQRRWYCWYQARGEHSISCEDPRSRSRVIWTAGNKQQWKARLNFLIQFCCYCLKLHEVLSVFVPFRLMRSGSFKMWWWPCFRGMRCVHVPTCL